MTKALLPSPDVLSMDAGQSPVEAWTLSKMLAYGDARAKEAREEMRAEVEGLRADVERKDALNKQLYLSHGRYRQLLNWVIELGLVPELFCHPDVGVQTDTWLVLHCVYSVDGNAPASYSKTLDGLIDKLPIP